MAGFTHPSLVWGPRSGNPLEFRDETYPRKTRGMGLLYGENCVILASTVLTDPPVWRTDRQTDRQTDGRTDRIAIAYTRYSYAVARKKLNRKSCTLVGVICRYGHSEHRMAENGLARAHMNHHRSKSRTDPWYIGIPWSATLSPRPRPLQLPHLLLPFVYSTLRPNVSLSLSRFMLLSYS